MVTQAALAINAVSRFNCKNLWLSFLNLIFAEVPEIINHIARI